MGLLNILNKTNETSKEKEMKGKVKWYNTKNGYGFITGEDNKDYFVHQTEIQKEGFRFLKPKQTVTFTPTESEKGLMATNVKAE